MKVAAAVLLGLVLAAPSGAQERVDPFSGVRIIDSHIKASWERLDLRPAREATDEEFLRRVTLDLTGVIPHAEDVEKFAKDRDSHKRGKKIDDLLASPAHANYWAQLWTVALVGWFQEEFEGYSRQELRDWVEEQFARDVPWNRIAQALLSATGSTVANRAANFAVRYLSESPEAFTTRVTKTFLGIRLNCAQCHDHPFDSWTREDFYGLASFLSRTQVAAVVRNGGNSYALADAMAGGGLQPEGFKAPVAARFLNGARPFTNLWRQEMALYVTRYPQFARAFVNRTWTQLMGRGIVHPPENFSKKNKPSHPEMLEELTKDFVAHGTGVKHLLRQIANSKAYQLSSENAGVKPDRERYFLTAIAKPLSPWQLYNSMARACGLEKDYAGEPGRFATDREGFVAQFADSLDSDSSASHAYTETSQNLLNNFSRDYLADAGTSEKHSLLALLEKAPKARKIELLYLSVLGRYPGSEERKAAQQYIDSVKSDDGTQAYRDLFYALINSHEFNFNH